MKKAGFACTWKIFNSKDCGVPQIRRRDYLIGCRGNVPNVPDAPMLQPPLLSEILDDDVGAATDLPDPNTVAGRSLRSFLHQLKKKKADIKNDAWVLDIDASPRFQTGQWEVSPTLTRSRSARYWVTRRRRQMNTTEQFRCQGFPTEHITALQSRRAMGNLAGNAMCVPVLTHSIDALLLQLGY